MRNAKEKVMLLGSYAGTAAIACKRFMILFFFLNVLRGSFHGPCHEFLQREVFPDGGFHGKIDDPIFQGNRDEGRYLIGGGQGFLAVHEPLDESRTDYVAPGKKLPARIVDQEKCIKCGMCIASCKFKAIEKK